MIELREALLAQVQAIRAGGIAITPNRDAEELRQLRVAVRRLRALLRAARPLILGRLVERQGRRPERARKAWAKLT